MFFFSQILSTAILRSAASASPDRSLRVVAWIAVGLVGLFLTLALLIP